MCIKHEITEIKNKIAVLSQELETLLNNVVCTCDKCDDVIETLDLSQLYHKIYIDLYDKWDSWYIKCNCGNEIEIKGNIDIFLEKYGTDIVEWEKQYKVINTINQYI
jgi:hypothetical protein